jgi:predicted branched-subunit amino acid permease
MTTFQSFVLGIRSSGGFFISTFLFGVMFAIAASSTGLFYWQAMLMSVSTFSASSQFASLEYWVAPLPVATIGLSVALISTRNILLGMSMAHQFDGHSLSRRLAWLFLLNDPGVVTSFNLDKKVDRLGYVTGYGVSLMISWLISITLGFLISGLFARSDLGALNFAGPLVMTTMMMLFVKGSKAKPMPWLISGMTALVLFEYGVTDSLILLLSVAAGVVAAIVSERV